MCELYNHIPVIINLIFKLILVLQVINLKKVLKGILDYYSEVLGQQIHDFHMPDVSAIGRNDSGATGVVMR